jgi:hypothetical protein
MEIAMRYGVTDTVLFNYGIASKRWVACAFVYGALSMPINDKTHIKLPVETEPKKDIEPRPENTDYIDDAVSILKRITPASAKYERKVIEQLSSVELMPFEIQGNTLLFTEAIGNRKTTIYVHNPDSKQPFVEGNLGNDGCDLSGLPIGIWKCQLSIIDGAVNDTYHLSIKNEGNNSPEFNGDVWRYTVLNAQPKTTEVFEDIVFNSTNQTSKLNPFIITLQSGKDGKPALSISYPIVLKEGYNFETFIYSIDTNQSSDLRDTIIPGNNSIIEPVIVDALGFETDYVIAVYVRNAYGDDVGLKGTIRLLNNNGKPDYLFDGRARTITVDGFEISDYE